MDPNVSKSMFLDKFKDDDDYSEEFSIVEENELLLSPKFKRLQSSPPRSSSSSPTKSGHNENFGTFDSIPDLQFKEPPKTPTKTRSESRIPLKHMNRKPPQPKFLPRTPTKIHGLGYSKRPEMKVSLTPAQRLEKKSGRMITTNDILASYEFKENIGKGAFANVYRAINKITGDQVAVKEILIEDDDNILELMSEIDLLKILKHRNIVKYHGFIRNERKLFIFLEYCSGGSLRSYYKKHGPLTEDAVITYIKQVLEGLMYLHEQGVVHRDVKAANILLTSGGAIKLTDFGVSTKVSSSTIKTFSIAGTPNWMAPEIISMDGTSTASDIWSVGATVLELLTAEPPYAHLNEMAALHAIVTDEFPPLPQFISPECHSFLLECFEKQPAKRLTAKQLRDHPWLTSQVRGNRIVDSIMLSRSRRASRLVEQDFNSIKRLHTKKFLPLSTNTLKHGDSEANKFLDDDLPQEFRDLEINSSNLSAKMFEPVSMTYKNDNVSELIESFYEHEDDLDVLTRLNLELGQAGKLVGSFVTTEFVFRVIQAMETKIGVETELTGAYLTLLHNLFKLSDLAIHDFTDLGGLPLLTNCLHSNNERQIRHHASEILTELFQRNSCSLRVFVQSGGLRTALKLLEEDFVEDQVLPQSVIGIISQSFKDRVVPEKILQLILLSFPNFLDWISVMVLHSTNVKNSQLADSLIDIICFTEGSKLLNLKPIFLNSIFKAYNKLTKVNQIKLLKFFKSVNVNDLPDSASMVKFLTKTIKRDVINTSQTDSDTLSLCCSLLFSMCHLNHARQVTLVRLGGISIVQELLNTTLPCSEFVIPLMCEFALNPMLTKHVMDEKTGLVRNYLELLIDPTWQANSLDSLTTLHEKCGDDRIAQAILNDKYHFILQSFLVEHTLNYELYMERLVRFLSTYSKSIVVNQIRLAYLNDDQIVGTIITRIGEYKSDLVILIDLFKLLKIIMLNNAYYSNYDRIINFLKSLKKTKVLLVDQLINEILSSDSESTGTIMKPPCSS